MAPLREGREQDVLRALAATPTGPESPFARIASTHFARWVVIPALLGGDGEPAEAPAYLLFAADFDGPLVDWSAAVAEQIGADIDRVFEHCDGYRSAGGRRGLLDFLRTHRIPVGFSVISYDATVARIRQSLGLRRGLREFAVASQALDAGELRREWIRRFGE